MKSLLFVISSFVLTILMWGTYGPLLHVGRARMASPPDAQGSFSLRPFICVGVAYFLIAVLAAGAYLYLRGEKGEWTFAGVLWSLAGGALGAVGALGVILAFSFGGRPIVVMPLVFGGAPVVNSFLTITLARKMKEVGPVFLAGLFMVVLGAVTVMIFQPAAPRAAGGGTGLTEWALVLLSVAIAMVCWGSYGPVLHNGQSRMDGSRLRPFICVGVAYFLVAVLVPLVLLGIWEEPSQFTPVGTLWSLAAGAAGALGALGIILAFNFGGKPVYVMPLVFGGAPVVNTIVTVWVHARWGEVGAFFYAGLILVIAGSAIVLVFAPRSGHQSPETSKA